MRLCPLDVTEVGTHPHRPVGPRQGGREDLRDPPNNTLVPALDFITWARHSFPSCSPLHGLRKEEP